jgi:DNA-binding NtrC family response regulator
MHARKLLIVDDEVQLLDLLKEEFEDVGVQCQTAENGFDALKILRTSPPDAVLCDINMPGLDGLDLLLEMHKGSIETPLIFLTGHGDKELAIRALRLGAFDFLSKPFDRKLLLSTVQSAIDVGVEMRTIEAELDEICARKDLEGKDLLRYRAMKKFFLRHKKYEKVSHKKAV